MAWAVKQLADPDPILQLGDGAPAAGALEGGGAFRPKVDLGEAGRDVDKEECAVLAGCPHLGQLPEPLHPLVSVFTYMSSRSKGEIINGNIQLIRQKSRYKAIYGLCEGFAGSHRGELASYGSICSYNLLQDF